MGNIQENICLFHQEGYDYSQHFSIMEDDTAAGGYVVVYDFGNDIGDAVVETDDEFIKQLLKAVDGEVRKFRNDNCGIMNN